MPRPRKYPDELIQRGVRLAIESGRPVRHVAADLGIHHETLRRQVREAEADGGLRPDLPTSEEREEIKKLRKCSGCAAPTISSKRPACFRDRADPGLQAPVFDSALAARAGAR